MSDKAPIVYDEDGNPLKVRIDAAKCVGEVSGEGHYGYEYRDGMHTTLYFEDASETTNNSD